MPRNNTRTELNRLLEARSNNPHQVAAIDAQIWQTFAETCAILVLDMSGFSRLTARHGIIHFLGMLQRLVAIATPIVTRWQGRVVKQEADNLFVIFPGVDAAVDAAIAILEALAEANTTLPDAEDMTASIGIGYGEVLVIEGTDLYGHEMNLASKLGEDLARSNEILMTEHAYQQLRLRERSLERIELTISGLEITAYRVPVAVSYVR